MKDMCNSAGLFGLISSSWVWCLSKPQDKGNSLCFKQSSITTTAKEAACLHLSVCMLILHAYSLSISGTLGGVPRMQKGCFYCLRLPGILLFCLPSSFNSIFFSLSQSSPHNDILWHEQWMKPLLVFCPSVVLVGDWALKYQISTNPSGSGKNSMSVMYL